MTAKHTVEDRLQTALAMTHHIQMRIAQCLARGEVSASIADDVDGKCKAIADSFYRARG